MQPLLAVGSDVDEVALVAEQVGERPFALGIRLVDAGQDLGDRGVPQLAP